MQPIFDCMCNARPITPIFYTLRRKPSRLFFTLEPPKKKINTENKSDQGKKGNHHLIDPSARVYRELLQYLRNRRRIHTTTTPTKNHTVRHAAYTTGEAQTNRARPVYHDQTAAVHALEDRNLSRKRFKQTQ